VERRIVEVDVSAFIPVSSRIVVAISAGSTEALMKAFFGGGGDQSESSALMLGDAGRRLRLEPRTRMSEDSEGSGLDAGVDSTAFPLPFDFEE